MSMQEIQRLVSRGEGENIEFKRKVAHPEKIIREIVAFANTKGGNLLIGVDDNGSIPGIKFADEEIFVLEKAIREWCRPKLEYEIEVVQINGKKSVVHYKIKESEKKPHYVLNEEQKNVTHHKTQLRKHKGKAYVRFEDKSLQASPEVWKILKRGRKPRDMKFTFGEKEKLLMEYLEKHAYITLSEFSRLARLPRFRASQTLVLLVLANVLKIIPREKEDIFMLKFS
ncbi:AlbA family DNA-binding domain-containing protein [Catalinimonas niigatensis]|uniref:AlbA family DNA-binding domain-containing protein n=1 Tax=Catalinimonas niigatensis TaxID=1397264 RepID=UPI0026664AB3|nr:ATP-binding protein [Catalinimonas niigatensis]WPP53447.1 ATP-binding protein [Catalinimonas niigatensis]